MKRRLYTLVAAMSLMLGAATAGLWVRSYWRVDVIGIYGREGVDRWQRGESAVSERGSLELAWWIRRNGQFRTRLPSAGWAYETSPSGSAVLARSWHGFSYDASMFDAVFSDGAKEPVQITYRHRVTVPHSFVVLLTVPLVVLWVQREALIRRTRHRLRHNLCPACGYDLSATPARCPECGAAPGAPS